MSTYATFSVASPAIHAALDCLTAASTPLVLGDSNESDDGDSDSDKRSNPNRGKQVNLRETDFLACDVVFSVPIQGLACFIADCNLGGKTYCTS